MREMNTQPNFGPFCGTQPPSCGYKIIIRRVYLIALKTRTYCLQMVTRARISRQKVFLFLYINENILWHSLNIYILFLFDYWRTTHSIKKMPRWKRKWDNFTWYTTCPRGLVFFYIANHCIKMDRTCCTYSMQGEEGWVGLQRDHPPITL